MISVPMNKTDLIEIKENGDFRYLAFKNYTNLTLEV